MPWGDLKRALRERDEARTEKEAALARAEQAEAELAVLRERLAAVAKVDNDTRAGCVARALIGGSSE